MDLCRKAYHVSMNSVSSQQENGSWLLWVIESRVLHSTLMLPKATCGDTSTWWLTKCLPMFNSPLTNNINYTWSSRDAFLSFVLWFGFGSLIPSQSKGASALTCRSCCTVSCRAVPCRVVSCRAVGDQTFLKWSGFKQRCILNFGCILISLSVIIFVMFGQSSLLGRSVQSLRYRDRTPRKRISMQGISYRLAVCALKKEKVDASEWHCKRQTYTCTQTRAQ